jgi:23S rRNA pseudouridine1911/1915/1917 synthase
MILPDILHQDDSLIILNKPSCCHSVSLPNDDKPSVASWLIQTFPGMEQVSKKVEDGGLVNRLDFQTSGILIAARTRNIWAKLFEMLRAGQIHKLYHAIVEGEARQHQIIDLPLGARGRRSNKVRVFERAPKKKDRAQPARSEITLLNYNAKLGLSLVEVRVDIGRRHQVRAHCSFAGHPLLGDSLYGSTRNIEELSSLADSPLAPLEFFLHARKAKLEHPQTGAILTITAEYPMIMGHFALK